MERPSGTSERRCNAIMPKRMPNLRQGINGARARAAVVTLRVSVGEGRLSRGFLMVLSGRGSGGVP